MAAGLPNVRDLGWFLLRIRVQQAKIRWPKSLGSLIWVPMRKRFEVQLTLGKTPIETVLPPWKSRDELPPILAGLKWIFLTPEINAQVFTLLEEKLVAGKKATGRPGLDLWQIQVLGVVRLGLDCDYDRLEHLANYDSLLRQILGLSPVRTGADATKRSACARRPGATWRTASGWRPKCSRPGKPCGKNRWNGPKSCS